MLDLTDDDYEALYFSMKVDMPEIIRATFPKLLEESVRDGTAVLTVTDDTVVLQTSLVAGGAVYQVERRRRLH